MDNPTDAISESISQHCIIQKAISTNKIPDLIDYLKQVSSRCVQNFKADLKKCTKLVRDEEGSFIISEDELEKCVKRNISPEVNYFGTQQIPFLENQKNQSDYYTYRRVPSIFINDDLVRGVVEGDLAAGAVCDSFLTVPISCKGLHLKTMTKVHSLLTVKHQVITDKRKSGFIWVVLGCLVLFAFSYLVFQRMIKSQLNIDLEERVNYTLNQYHRVKEGGDEGHRPVNVSQGSMETEGGISSEGGL